MRITLVESEEIGIIGVGEATVPLFRHFNETLGVDEHAFRGNDGQLQAGHRILRLGTDRQHPLSRLWRLRRADCRRCPHHHWLRLSRAGDTAPIDDHSAPYALAQRGKFTPADPRQPRYAHAYHFDAVLYARYLRGLAEGWGVTRVKGGWWTSRSIRKPDISVRLFWPMGGWLMASSSSIAPALQPN
jgi:tryptophan halogenase